jgi:glycosyltransferase involved in cell wall biosynthesis
MRVTVAICTWNRPHLLQQALEHMTRLMIPPGLEWELLIVNNACTDGTDRVIASFIRRLPLRRLYEPNPGLSNARNLAVREARGEYILWTDDDALVDDHLLVSYIDAFRQWPEAAFFGGPVYPWFAVPPPRWLRRAWPRVVDAYAVRDLGDRPIRFDGAGLLPYGANFVVRMNEQRRHPYDPRLGHRREDRIGGEEMKLLRELMSQGGEGWWVPGARVRHVIPSERMTTRYLRTYYRGHGRYLERTQSGQTDEAGPAGGSPRDWRAVFSAIRKETRYRCRRVICPPERWIQDLIAASQAWGRLLEKESGPDEGPAPRSHC